MLDDTSKAILRKLFYDRRIGGRHLGLEDLKRGFPSHQKGDVDKKLKKLVKDNYILQHPTSYGPQYALNPQRLQDVIDILNSK
ncbi:MAG: hypothetical protein QXN55_09250 [Candidatus Nitrosotenuis sp.]